MFPKEIATYHEPFIGGGAVLLQLLQSGRSVKLYVAGDHYAPLVEMWKKVKDAPATVMTEYRQLWRQLTDTGMKVYDEVRRRFNEDHDPLKLFFLLRVTRDGRFVFRRDGRLYCRLRALATDEMALVRLMKDCDFSAVWLFHEGGVPQVVQTHEEWFMPYGV